MCFGYLGPCGFHPSKFIWRSCGICKSETFVLKSLTRRVRWDERANVALQPGKKLMIVDCCVPHATTQHRVKTTHVKIFNTRENNIFQSFSSYRCTSECAGKDYEVDIRVKSKGLPNHNTRRLTNTVLHNVIILQSGSKKWLFNMSTY